MEDIECYGVYEVTFKSDEKILNPFTDIQVHAQFAGPDKKIVEVDGFYYQNNLWMVRFSPHKVGEWNYTLEIKGEAQPQKSFGNFNCTVSKRHGFLRISKRNAYRFEYDDGLPFYPIGQQVGWGIPHEVGFDAPDDKDWVNADRETFMKVFTGATNLMRSQLGCGTSAGVALQILSGKNGLDCYEIENCLKLDESCKILKKNEWGQIMIPFQDMSLWGDGPSAFGNIRDTQNYKTLNNPQLPMIDQYLRYVVARWSVYVDIWEIYNEDSYAPNNYLAHLAKVIREADPYTHPIMTSYERPAEPWCEIISVHEYMGNPSNEIPSYLSKEFARLKSYGKPVLYTEFGNQAKYSNDDPIKWRVAVWTAFMNECGLGFWNMSGRRTLPKEKGSPVNAYLGSEARQSFKVLAEFTRDLPLNLRPVTPGFTSEFSAQSWALGNEKLIVLYVHQFRTHEQPVKIIDPLQVWTGPGKFYVKWIKPATGEIIKEEDISNDSFFMKIQIPEFTIDLAARIELIDEKIKFRNLIE